MEVKLPDGFEDRLIGIVETTPVQPVENLIRALLPRVAVSTKSLQAAPAVRKYNHDDDSPTDEPPTAVINDPFRRKMKSPRMRKVRGQRYQVLNSYAYANHRRGTWRYAMVMAAVFHEGTNASDTITAQAKLRDSFPQYADQSIDFAWLAKQGYISF